MDTQKESGIIFHKGIGEIADLLNISKSALRYYDSNNLLTPQRDNKSNYREYSFINLIELTDIILYRNLGVPVKSIDSAMKAPLEHTLRMVEDTIEKTNEQIQTLSKTLMKLVHFERRMRYFLSIRDINYKVVNTPNVKQITSWNLNDPDNMQEYLYDPYNYPYAVYFSSAEDTQTYIDGISGKLPSNLSSLVWQEASHQCEYLECITRTDYGLTEINNISDHLDYMDSKGLTPGFLIGEYLSSNYSKEENKKFDYYHTWIEIKA